jgi:hypothetical protein
VKKSGARIPCDWDRRRLSPARPVPARRRFDPGALEDLPHGGRRYRDAEPGQLAVDPPVAPGLVLPGQPQHFRPDLTVRRRAAIPAADNVLVPRNVVPGVTISRIAASRPAGSVPAGRASHARSGHVSRDEISFKPHKPKIIPSPDRHRTSARRRTPSRASPSIRPVGFHTHDASAQPGHLLPRRSLPPAGRGSSGWRCALRP